MSRIVSVWLPAFPIERMRRQTPASVSEAEPLALVEKGPHGPRISAANGAALAAGIEVGGRLADARAALPRLRVRPADPARDAAMLAALAGWLGRYGPASNTEGPDGAWIDVTGVPHLFGGEEALCAHLHRRLDGLGLTACIGLADTPGAAHALARFAVADAAAGGIAIAPAGTVRAVLAGLPVAALRLAPETRQLLVRLGLKRIGQLYGLPRAALAARFRAGARQAGRQQADGNATAVLLRLDQALGHLAEPRAPLCPPPEAESRLAFPEPLVTDAGIAAALDRLAGVLTGRLADQGLGARRFRLALYRTDGTVATAAIGTSRPGRDPAHICRLMRERLGTLDAGFGIDLATLEAAGLEPLEARQGSLDAAVGRVAGGDAAALIDRLANRLGAGRVVHLVPEASHMPERAEIRIPAMAADEARKGARSGAPPPGPQDQVDATNQKGCRPPRPPLLFDPPEPIAVIAEVPDGAPQRFVWRRLPRAVVHSEGPERIAPEWWRRIGVKGQPARTRDYYRLEDATGARYWVFREGLYRAGEAGAGEEELSPRWFVHGLFP
jgi:protein ImuB